MDYGSGVYNLVLLLHLLAAIAGFGPTLLAPAFAAQGRARRGNEGLAIFDATYTVMSTYATWIVYSVPVFGILLVILGDPPWSFSQTWISMSFLLYIVLIGLLHAVHQPNLRRMGELMRQLADGPPPPGAAAGGPPAEVAEIEARGKRAGIIGGLLNLLFVVILIMMVWKPGAPG